MNRKLQNTFCFQDETFEDACCYIFTSKNTLLNASKKLSLLCIHRQRSVFRVSDRKHLKMLKIDTCKDDCT